MFKRPGNWELCIGLVLLLVGCTSSANATLKQPEETLEDDAAMVSEVESSELDYASTEVRGDEVREEVPAGALDGEPGEYPSQAPSSAAMADGASAGELDDEVDLDTGGWQMHVNETYRFSFLYPPYHTLATLQGTELAQLFPIPLFGLHVRETRGALADISPPHFAIHVFENETQLSIERWLSTSGPLSQEGEWITETYIGESIQGVKVISTNYMAPGWSVYTANGPYIFQLTPLGEQGELMLSTFKWMQ